MPGLEPVPLYPQPLTFPAVASCLISTTPPVPSAPKTFNENKRISVDFYNDGFLKDDPITVDSSLSKIKFKIENRSGDSHITRIEVTTKKDSYLEFRLDGKKLNPEKICKSCGVIHLGRHPKSCDCKVCHRKRVGKENYNKNKLNLGVG